MKQVLRSALPTSLVVALIEARDRRRLAAIPPRQIDCSGLAVTTAEDLSGMRKSFDSDALAHDWARDKSRIEGLLGPAMYWGGVNPGDGRALYYAVRTLAPGRVLEVGTHIGASTLHIAAALSHGLPGAWLTTVDILDVNDAVDGPWRAKGLTAPPKQLLESLETGVEMTFARSRAVDFMRASSERFDLIFLDGSHSADDTYQEVAAALPVLNPGATVLLHDFYPGGQRLFPNDRPIRGPYEALCRLEEESPSLTVLPFGELPWPTRPGSHATSLAVLARRERVGERALPHASRFN